MVLRWCIGKVLSRDFMQYKYFIITCVYIMVMPLNMLKIFVNGKAEEFNIELTGDYLTPNFVDH